MAEQSPGLLKTSFSKQTHFNILNSYPPAEHNARASRSSKVFGKMEVKTDADTPAAPNPPKVLKT